jgi:hypothetical protein
MKKLTFVGFWLISVDLRLTKVSVIPVVISRAATEVDARCPLPQGPGALHRDPVKSCRRTLPPPLSVAPVAKPRMWSPHLSLSSLPPPWNPSRIHPPAPARAQPSHQKGRPRRRRPH